MNAINIKDIIFFSVFFFFFAYLIICFLHLRVNKKANRHFIERNENPLYYSLQNFLLRRERHRHNTLKFIHSNWIVVNLYVFLNFYSWTSKNFMNIKRIWINLSLTGTKFSFGNYFCEFSCYTNNVWYHKYQLETSSWQHLFSCNCNDHKMLIKDHVHLRSSSFKCLISYSHIASIRIFHNPYGEFDHLILDITGSIGISASRKRKKIRLPKTVS